MTRIKIVAEGAHECVKYLCGSVLGSLSKSGALVDNVQRTRGIVDLITPFIKLKKSPTALREENVLRPISCKYIKAMTY